MIPVKLTKEQLERIKGDQDKTATMLDALKSSAPKDDNSRPDLGKNVFGNPIRKEM